ncbi:hypothetical protein EDB19DRAFT_1962911 [Suillus lakei]|nr:hypothetical protein EDB19DRAFT_1962911 [Suillus lakei]
MGPLASIGNNITPGPSVIFKTAEFLYTRNQMSAGDINILLDLWAATLLKHNNKLLFVDCHDLHKTIDSTLVGDVKWQSFKVQYSGEKPAHNIPPWMDQSHDVIQNMLANPDYATEMDYWPYRKFSTDSNARQWQDFMSADIISKDPDTTGSTFVPVILSSDKTTVSVATGANNYYLLYVSIGNVHNNVQRVHHDAVAIISFLAMPKTTKEHTSCPKYRKYCHQLFHSSILKILENLRPGMTKPEVVRFSDGHYWHVIYGLGPYIADYEEQVLLVCIVRSWCPRCMSHHKNLDANSLCCSHDHTEALIEEVSSTDLWDEYGVIHDLLFTNDFPQADIYQLITPDLLHQLIKGTFKDHLVDWVRKYLHHVFASFSGFKQWTSDDSKALMKVYLPAIEGYVPTDVVHTFHAFLEFCYLVRHNTITESTLVQIQDALDRFHHYRKVFESTGVVPTFSLPRQHSCSHYILLIRLFGTPNGLCFSITETKHIKAVKEPWRRSSCYKALGKMLVTNQRLDKLAASHINFKSRGMLNGTCLSETLRGDNEEGEVIDGPMLVQAHVQLAKMLHNEYLQNFQHHVEHKCARTIPDLSAELTIPHLYNILHQFLFGQVNPDDERSPSEVPLAHCPRFDGKIQVFNSVSSTFYAPSDHSGIGGMCQEHIRACPVWRNEAPRYDCVFVNTDASVKGMGGMDIAHVMCFFTFTFEGISYPCAVVRWFDKADNGPDEDTGMWIVKPLTHAIPQDLKHYDSYDAFRTFYVNKFADHHAFEITS